MKVGDGCVFHQRNNLVIDLTRPSLLTIGNNVHITDGVKILTHGYDWIVLRNVFDEMVASSGKVVIGNNVFIGMNAILIKGVSVGDNSIIGAGSVVTKDIPAGSVVAGNPAKVICDLNSYYIKRKKLYVSEAKDYARSIVDRYGRAPLESDFWEEFPIFSSGSDLFRHPVSKQLGVSVSEFDKINKPHYANFDEFLKDCGLV